MTRAILLFFSSTLLAGCVSFNIPTYTPENQNIEAIGKRSDKFNIAIEKPLFEDTGKILCRGAGDVTVQQDKTYGEYIIDALKNELKSQDLLDDKSNKIVSIKLTKLDFSSSLGATNWFIDSEYVFNGKSQSISTIFNMDSNYFGNVACNNMALNFPKAVSQHLNQFYKSSIFLAAAGEKRANNGAVSPNSRLENLKKAFQDGLISEDEYKVKRNQILQDF